MYSWVHKPWLCKSVLMGSHRVLPACFMARAILKESTGDNSAENLANNGEGIWESDATVQWQSPQIWGGPIKSDAERDFHKKFSYIFYLSASSTLAWLKWRFIRREKAHWPISFSLILRKSRCCCTQQTSFIFFLRFR